MVRQPQLFVLFLFLTSFSQANNSIYLSLSSDIEVSGSNTLLSTTLILDEPSSVLLVSDGRFFPAGPAVGGVWITVDNTLRSSQSIIDWSDSSTPVQHCFGVTGLLENYPAGEYQVSLIASTLNGQAFMVGSGSNLIAFILPTNVTAKSSSLSADSPTYSFAVQPDQQPLPTFPALSINIPSFARDYPVVSLASGRSYAAGNFGDAVWFLYFNNDSSLIFNNRTLHADNDIYSGAEGGNAPMYTHGFFESTAPLTTVTLAASAESWTTCCNTVQYKIGAFSNLVSMTGFPISGRLSLTDTVNVGNVYVCVGTSEQWPNCPPVADTYKFISTNFDIPSGHSGILMFSFKTIIQADAADFGGTAEVQLAIDGVRVGNPAVQQLATPNCVSTRTMTASYLSSAAPLSPGSHKLEVLVDVLGGFIHLSFSAQLPLIWFG